jgi:hypothetical protein
MGSAAGAVGVSMGLARLLSQNVLLPVPRFVHHAESSSGVHVVASPTLPSTSAIPTLPQVVSFHAEVGWGRRALWGVVMAAAIGGGVAVSGLRGSTTMFAALVAYRDLRWFSWGLTVLWGLHVLTRVCARPTLHLPFPFSLCLVALRSTLSVLGRCGFLATHAHACNHSDSCTQILCLFDGFDSDPCPCARAVPSRIASSSNHISPMWLWWSHGLRHLLDLIIPWLLLVTALVHLSFIVSPHCVCLIIENEQDVSQ